MTNKTSKPTERHTSYHHPEKTFSILGEAQKNGRACFEYNGIEYTINNQSLNTNGEVYQYVMPWDGAGDPINPQPPKTLATLNGVDFKSFIKIYEIEGKSLEWILEHQRTWKYKLTAEHFERVLTGFSFCFVYRGTPCYIYATNEHDNPQPTDGRYLRILAGIQYDVTRYAPLSLNAKHWITNMPGYYDTELTPNNIIIGPFQTVGGLLDTIRFGGKTLREIFDTEYNDGDVLCGIFEG